MESPFAVCSFGKGDFLLYDLLLLSLQVMAIIPDKYIPKWAGKFRIGDFRKVETAEEKKSGWMSLSPLFVFLGVYLISSVLAADFYKVPIAAAFLIASAYALFITKAGSVDDRVAVFSQGAGNKNVLLMIWIFVLAGAFAGTAKDIGAIDATVNLTLSVLPWRFLYSGLFLSACFISMAVGTSVGTIVALVPVASGIAAQTGCDVAFITAIIVGGAFFGDNLSFISDTTIAATKTQGCSMKDKFKVNIMIVAPAAVIVTILYVLMGTSADVSSLAGHVDIVKLIPYILVIGLALLGVNVVCVLATGIVVNAIIGFIYGAYNWVGWLSSVGSGIGSMGELIIVTMLAGGMLEVIRFNGGLDFIIRGLTRRIKGKRGAEFSIAALVSLANLCTANNTIAIITSGRIARDITKKFGLDPRKTASILDTFSCLVQGLIPYGAQMLMASGLAAVSAASIISYLYYPMTMGIFAVLSILFRFPRKYSSRL